MLRTRALALQAVREFFNAHSYLEVDTPCLSAETVVDAWLDPPGINTSNGRKFLQTSPEALMKRLLAAGSGSIWQAARVFRNGERGHRHNPEFTMLEWYGVDSTWLQQMQLTELLVREVLNQIPQNRCLLPAGSFQVLTYEQAFLHALNCNPHSCSDELLRQLAQQHTDSQDEFLQIAARDDLLNLLLGVVIEPRLGCRNGQPFPQFLCDYPPSQAALAVTEPAHPTEKSTLVARRFELYINGIELCNGYQELQNPAELQQREQQSNQLRYADQRDPLPGAPRLVAAMQHGLPECSGVALGFDRLLMLACGTDQIADVLPFSDDRA